MNLSRISLLTVAFIACWSLAGADDVRVETLEITPAAKPDPAMRYRLYPTAREMKEGNAAGLYYRAFLELTLGARDETWEKTSDLLKLTPKELPREDALKVLGASVSARREAARTARRRQANWDIPVREDGVDTHLLEVQDARPLARALALQARLDAVEGHYVAAIESLETAIALARHISESGTLISSLVGVAAFSIAADEIEHMAEMPGSPNLYWALTALPDPLIDLRIGFESEQLWPEGSLTHFNLIGTAILSEKQADELGKALGELLAEAAGSDNGIAKISSDDALKKVLAGYERCKQQLISQGRDQAMIEAMPKVQVVTLRGLEVLRDVLDEHIAYFGRPQFEINSTLESLDAQQDELMRQPEGYLLQLLLPATQAAKAAFTRHSQRVEVLRVIEALRLHAATHDGKLPAQLADIDAVPIPLDPASGQPFDYKVEDGKAILLPTPLNQNVRYEITVRK